MKRLVGRASAPARRSTQAGKPVPPEEIFRTECFGTVGHELLASPINGEKSGRSASKPASFGGTGFQPVHHTGKMPMPPKNCFRLSCPSAHSPNYFSQSLASWRDLWLF